MIELGPTSPAGGGLRKHRTRPFLQIPSDTVRDRALSFRARGVLAWLLDQPDGWDVRAAVIAGHGTEGRDAIEAALRELRAAGYYRLERRRLPGGSFAMGTAVAETAQPSWAASHAAHNGGAVPVEVRLNGLVVELDPRQAPETDSQGPANPAPVDPGPPSRSLSTEEKRQTEKGEGTLVGDGTRGDVPKITTPPSRTCRKGTAPHGACGPCATDREALTAYEAALTEQDREHARRLAAADREAALLAAAQRAAALEACPVNCDLDGVATVETSTGPVALLCTHDVDRNLATALARAAARAAVPTTRSTASTRARRRASTQLQEA